MATKYIRVGASGSGSGDDWTNAYASFSAAGLHNSSSATPRANTYYVAGSDTNYGAVEFKNAESGTSAITIKKATAVACSGISGWNADYETKTVKFTATGSTPVKFSTGYYVFDGVTGGGPGAWNSGHGFHIYADPANLLHMISMRNDTSPVTNVMVRHCKMEYTNVTATAYTDCDTFHIASNINTNDITVSYCSFLKCGRTHVMLAQSHRFLAEYNYFYWCKMYAGQHSASLSDQGSHDVILRHNLYHDCKGTSIIVSLSRTAGLQISSDDWKIYGNIFYASGARPVDGQTHPSPPYESLDYDVIDGVIASINPGTAGTPLRSAYGWEIHHNTFVSINKQSPHTLVLFSWETPGSYTAYNNLAYDCVNASILGVTNVPGLDEPTVTHDYNHFQSVTGTTPTETHKTTGSGNPFTSINDSDFSLTAAIGAGTALASPFNVDIAGVTRGHDGTIDAGAYEWPQRDTRHVLGIRS
jgi:hypothetical protein